MSEIEQRADIVRMLVLSEVSDDYEEFGHICAGLATFDGKVGLPIQPTWRDRHLMHCLQMD